MFIRYSDVLFWDEAPGDFDIEESPYIVISEILTIHSKDTVTKFLDVNFQISIYCRALSDGETIESAIIPYLESQGTYFSFINYRFMNLTINNQLERKVDEKFHQLIIESTLNLEKI